MQPKQAPKTIDAYIAGFPPDVQEILRNIVLALVIDYLAVRLGVVNWTGALKLGLLLWVGFPAILLTGSIIRENYPRKLAAIHAGDWLLKLVLMSEVVSLWH